MELQKTAGAGMKTGREEQLQFLRFLAFVNIFMYHSEQWIFFEYPVSHCAFAAVSFFFVLSGLVSGYTLCGKEINTGLKSIGVFLWKKIRRLYPLYFCTTVFAVLLTNLPETIVASGIAAGGAALEQLLRSLLLIQAWFPEGYYAYNGLGWFLSVMMFLYLLTLPAMAVLRKVDARPRRYFLLAFLAGGLLFATAAYCYVTQRLDMSYWHYIFPPARAGEYLVGMILGVGLFSLKPRLRKGMLFRVVFTALEIAVLVYWVHSLSSPGNYWRNHIVSWLIPNLAVLTVFMVGGGWVSALFRCRALVRLGDVSFSCYLIHQLLINLYNTAHPEAVMSQQGKIAAFGYCLTASVLFALCLEKKKK